MDATRLSTFPGWMHPAERKDPVIPALLFIPSEQNAPGLQGRGAASWVLCSGLSLHVGEPLPTGAASEKEKTFR